MDIINLTYNFLIDPYSQWAVFIASFIFMLGYTWAAKVDDTTTVQAAHVNLLQTEKLDRDGKIPATGTIQWDKGADIASAAELVPGADGNCFDVTGTTTITSIAAVQSQPGTIIKLHFDAILIIEHDGDNIILPDGKNIYTMAGTELIFTEYSAGKWRCTGYLRGVPVLTNLFSNSGIGYWPQSDASKGLATITYDQGAKGAGSAPSVGDAVVGGVSGATAKVISYTILTGTFATGDATGVVTVGAVSHDFAFVDNETITFEGVETAVINMPDSAVGVGLVRNGGFAVDTDPTPGWTASNATLSTEAGGLIGNCMKVLDGGAGNGYGYQQITTVVGKIYKVSVWAKDIDTGTNGLIEIGTAAGGAQYYSSGAITDDAGDTYTATFKATTTTTFITLNCTSTGGAYYFDEVTAYEITPCCTAADDKAFDGGWAKDDDGLHIYRQHNDGGTLTKDGSFYALKAVPMVADVWLMWDFPRRQNEEYLQQFNGRTITLGCWAKTSTASHFRVTIFDTSSYSSPYHTGGGDWEWLELTRTVDSASTIFRILLSLAQSPNVDGSTIVYISQPMLVFGSHIGEGNYQSKPNDFLWGAKPIPSNTYDGLLNQSDIAYADFDVESEFDAMVPKGCKVIAVQTDIEDSGSGAGLDVHLELRKDATAGTFFINSVAGKPNDIHNHLSGLQPCDENGDIDIHLDASGASTLDINTFECHGVQVS